MRKKQLSTKKLKEFGFLIGFCFPLIIGWLIPAFWGHSFRFWSIWVGLFALTITIIKPRLLFYPYKLWMLLGHVLGWINSRIILTMVFIFVLLPISLIMKSFGYDPLRIKKKNDVSYREINDNHIIDFTRIF